MASGSTRTFRQAVAMSGTRKNDVCSRVRQRAEADPGRLFCKVLIAGRSRQVTYGALWDAALRYSAIYLERGVGPGDVVLIILRHGPDLFSSFLGAMLVGALPSFLPFPTSKQHPELYWATLAALISRIGARLLVTWGENLVSMQKSMPGISIAVHLAEDIPQDGQVPVIESRTYAGPAFLQHSSGTTGLKKGVVITHEALNAQVQAYARAIELDEQDVIVSWLPLYHDMGLVACFLLPTMLGVPIVAMDAFEWVLDPGMLFDAVESHRCTLLWLPNFAFHHLCSAVAAQRRWDLGCVKAIIDCSEPCKPDTFRLFASRFGSMGIGLDKLQTCYALAENVFAATQSSPGRPVTVIRADRRALYEEQCVRAADDTQESLELLSCGRPIDGVRISIQDPQGASLAENRIGEIAISGISLFSGYLQNADETNARLSDGWYRTRDLGFVNGGELYITGRVDDLLIVHGVNYYAHDIEYAVNRVPGIIAGRCVAVGEFKSDAGTAEVMVLAEVESQDNQRAAEIKHAVKLAVLSETGLLVHGVGIVPEGWLIKTTSGKISRSENLKKFRERK